MKVREAMTSKVCSAAGDIPSGCGERTVALDVADALSTSGDRRRRASSASGTIVATQKTPMPRYVRRQPCVSMKCCTMGGHAVPAT